MDPQVKSILTSIAMAGATAVAAWAVGHGIIPGSEAGDFSNMLVTVVFGLITAGLAEYKRRQATPVAQTAALAATKEGQTAMIKTINNTSNGVKVVDATVPAPTVQEPLK
jgi:hypothetical protein